MKSRLLFLADGIRKLRLEGSPTPHLMQVLHDVFAARFEVSNEGRLVADRLEVVDGQINAHGPGKSEQREKNW